MTVEKKDKKHRRKTVAGNETEVKDWDSLSYSWKDKNSETLKINASKMYNMLNRIASENDVWTVGEVKRLLASVSKGLTQLG